MRIGSVAAQADVNVQTVRLYERLGLLKKPGRLASGYREYTEDAVMSIRFVKQAKGLGFTLTEIKSLLDMREEGAHTIADMRSVARAGCVRLTRRSASFNRCATRSIMGSAGATARSSSLHACLLSSLMARSARDRESVRQTSVCRRPSSAGIRCLGQTEVCRTFRGQWEESCATGFQLLESHWWLRPA
jgi:MerR family transcriptional regulator, mercuric resistance operon regulatory protein